MQGPEPAWRGLLPLAIQLNLDYGRGIVKQLQFNASGTESIKKCLLNESI